GRRQVLMSVLFIGFISFVVASLLEEIVLALTICLFIAGMAVGSTFSLGITYMADLMPKNLLPTGNLLCGVAFSIGSLIGPYFGGLFIELFKTISFFNIISVMLLIIFGAVTFFGNKGQVLEKSQSF
ncbi:MFS transporter, partial [Diaphorobacter sp. DS2]